MLSIILMVILYLCIFLQSKFQDIIFDNALFCPAPFIHHKHHRLITFPQIDFVFGLFGKCLDATTPGTGFEFKSKVLGANAELPNEAFNEIWHWGALAGLMCDLTLFSVAWSNFGILYSLHALIEVWRVVTGDTILPYHLSPPFGRLNNRFDTWNLLPAICNVAFRLTAMPAVLFASHQ